MCELLPNIMTFKTIKNRKLFIRNGGCVSDELLILQDYLGFDYEIIEDIIEGIKLQNGSWIGRIGRVARKEADIGVLTGISYDRLDVIDYSDVRHILPVKFAIKKPDEVSKVLALIYPFTVQAWIIIAITLFIAGLLFYWILNFDASIHKKKSVKLYNVIWALFGTFTNKGNSLFDVDGSCRMMVFGWLISFFVLVTSYSGALISFLTFLGYEYAPQTFPELIEGMQRGYYTSSLLFHTGIGEYIRDATKQTPLLSKLKELSDEGKVGNIHPTDDIYESLLKPKNALIFYEINLLIHLSALGADEYIMSKDALFTQNEVYVLTKDFLYKKEFNLAIRRMIEGGLIKHAIDIQINILRNTRSIMKKPRELDEPLTISDLIGVFALLFVGYTLSIIIFLLEITKIPINIKFPVIIMKNSFNTDN